MREPDRQGMTRRTFLTLRAFLSPSTVPNNASIAKTPPRHVWGVLPKCLCHRLAGFPALAPPRVPLDAGRQA